MSEVTLEYCIVWDHTRKGLADHVAANIADGWFPLGGVAVAWKDNQIEYLQAMARTVYGDD